MENRLRKIRPEIHRLLAEGKQVLVAIDGSCTSGKSTLAAALEQEYPCNVFHMDDFFLRPQQRTEQRLAEPGGNVDYERFYQEVLLPLKAGNPFSYPVYDCSVRELVPGPEVQPRQLNIVEGTYSQHPFFGECYDLKIFLTVDPELRRQRIARRPAFLHRRFFEEWIPMEQRYFAAFSLEEKADLVL